MKRVRDPLDPNEGLLMVTKEEWDELKASRKVRVDFDADYKRAVELQDQYFNEAAVAEMERDAAQAEVEEVRQTWAVTDTAHRQEEARLAAELIRKDQYIASLKGAIEVIRREDDDLIAKLVRVKEAAWQFKQAVYMARTPDGELAIEWLKRSTANIRAASPELQVGPAHERFIAAIAALAALDEK